MGSRRWPATDDFGPSSDPHPLVKSGCCSVTQMASNGRSEMTPVPWILILAFILHHPSHATSLPPAPAQLGTSWCVDNGCSEQFQGLGGCVNLAAPLQISKLSKRFDLGATSLKGLCGSVGCCHCMKLLHNSTEPPIAGESKPAAKKPSAKKPGAKRPTKLKPKKPKPMKPKPKRSKSKKPKSKKQKSKKSKSKKPKSKKPKSKKPKSKKPKPKKPQKAKKN